MSVSELKKAYDELQPGDQLVFATLVAADQMAKREDFQLAIERRHQAIDQGKKWAHDDVLRLHKELSESD